jgi:hypothetical protein
MEINDEAKRVIETIRKIFSVIELPIITCIVFFQKTK